MLAVPPFSALRRMTSPATRRGNVVLRLMLVLAVVVGAGWLAMNYLPRDGSNASLDAAMLTEVTRGDFELLITERGEIESVGDVEVRSEVKSQNTPGLSILRIVPEGEMVKEGDFLIELDSSALQEDRTKQKIAVNTAEALLVEARNLYETAEITLEEYREGVFVQERQTLESEKFVAEENLSRAEEYLEYSKKLASKGYVSDLQLEADAFAVDKSKKELDAAKTKLDVLDKFTKAKMLKQFQSDVLITKARWEAEKNSLQLELDKLHEIEDQLAKCIITAPREGLVKYAHVRDRGGQNDFIVEEGAVVRERQTIIRMPDTTQMRVKLNVNESLIQYVREGMPARIKPIGMEGVVLPGVVDYVNQYAEPTGWRKANVKEYKAYVKLDGSASGLRTGMTASVTIESLRQPSALQMPVQAVYLHGGQAFCFVERGGKLIAQPVTCGATNERFYVVEEGLNDSDRVAMNPRQLLELVDLPPLVENQSPPAAEEEQAPPRTTPPTVAARQSDDKPSQGS